MKEITFRCDQCKNEIRWHRGGYYELKSTFFDISPDLHFCKFDCLYDYIQEYKKFNTRDKDIHTVNK